MKKYYYDCPIKAAYMSENFGAVIISNRHGKNNYDYQGSEIVYWTTECTIEGPYYIDDKIIIPIPDDIIEHYNGIFYKVIDEPLFYMNEPGGFISVEPTSASYYNRTDGRQGISINSIKRIVLRRGTEFIWPKEDV